MQLSHQFILAAATFIFIPAITETKIEKRSDDDKLINLDNINNEICTVDKQLVVEYSGISINCGESYHLAGFESTPVIHAARANVNKFYTLVMLDPDAPSAKNPKFRSWLHWLVVNIEDADVKTGFVVTEYNPPSPPPGSGFHKYVFLLIEQTEKETHYLPIKDRAKFDVNKYVKKHKLGNLAGISFYKTEYKKI